MINRILTILLALSPTITRAADARITVHADHPLGQISPYDTGAGLEDVNHEVYGGLYSQMIFGESFQEPAASLPPKGFTAFGGDWQVKNGELHAGPGDGPKLISDEPPFSTGEASVELLFPEKHAGSAALIFKVDQPAIGADKWFGYEIGLDAPANTITLGRHRNNWEPIKTISTPLPLNKWIPLTVRFTQTTIEALIDGQSVLKYEDTDHPLKSGKVGLRPWQRAVHYRNLTLKTADHSRAIPFEAPASTWPGSVSGMWSPIQLGSAVGDSSLESDHPFIGAQSQRLTFKSGEGEIGLENRGLNRWGLNFVADKPYEGYLWVRADRATDLTVAAESAVGARIYTQAALPIKPGDWQRIDFNLVPTASDASGRFTIKLKSPGAVLLGHVFLQPGEWGRFKDLPVRKDVAQALINQGLTVLRYGGSMINSPEYRWKKMIGPRDRRPPYNTWYRYDSNGWGIIDFLNFTEAANFLGIPALNMDETPQDMADFIEYVNGPAESDWGKRRAADGHPAPFKLKYLELGNEEAINETYLKKFKPLAEAIWSKDPTVIPVVGDFAYGDHITDPYDFKGAPNITSLAVHKQILDFAIAQKKAVWFDVHISNDNAREPTRQIEVLAQFSDWLGKISPGANYKVCVFEENSGNHLLRRGLGHAHAINAIQRLTDRIPILCAANCLQPDGQNDNGWDQGLLFLNPSQVWAQPSFYITQMIASNNLPTCIKADVQSPKDALDVTAKLSEDKKILSLQIVNMDDAPLETEIALQSFTPTQPNAHLTQLSGPLTAANTAAIPTQILPKETDHPLDKSTPALSKITIPPNSVTILRFE